MTQKLRAKEWDGASFPALYRSADDASTNAQWWYLFWVRINLGLLVVGVLFNSLVLSDIEHRRFSQGAAATCYFLALGTTILLATRRWERVWYAGRAVAESVKSLAWKFIMGADPFPVALTAPEAVDTFTRTLQDLLRENRHLAIALLNEHVLGEQVTPQMTATRAAAVGVLRDLYLAQRVNEQQVWYANSAAKNRLYRNVWFSVLVLFQGAAGLAAILLTINPTIRWRASTFFTTLASVTIAWGQLKRFQELAQAYSLAAQELSLIAARAGYVGTHEQLARFVNDAETAISREHATWFARRETT